MLRSTILWTLLSLQGVFADAGEEGRRAVVVSSAGISSRDALPSYDFGGARKRQDDNNNDDDDDEKTFSLPQMENMAGNLNIADMDDIDLPRLATVDGNLTIAATSNLETLTLPALRRVGGNLVLDGRFAVVDLPALAEVGGVVSVASFHSDFNCTALKADLADVDVGGDFLCQDSQSDDDDDNDDDENDRDDDDNANEDDNDDDDDDGDDTSGAAGPPRLGWPTLLVMPALLML